MDVPAKQLAELFSRLARGDVPSAVLEQCLQGRALGMRNHRLSHIFSTVSLDSEDWQLPNVPVPNVGWTNELEGATKSPRLWQVSSAVAEILRVVPESLSPLSNSELLALLNTDPFSATVGGTSTLGLRVIASSDAGSKVFDMDIGQTIELFAQRIDVQVYGPTGAYQINTDIPTVAEGSGGAVVADTYVGVSINPIEESRGATTVRRSQILSVAANATVTFTVPRYAVRASFSQNTSGLAPVQFQRFAGDPATLGRQIGTIDFVGRNAPDVPLGQETHIRSNSDAARRVYEVAWLIQP